MTTMTGAWSTDLLKRFHLTGNSSTQARELTLQISDTHSIYVPSLQ